MDAKDARKAVSRLQLQLIGIVKKDQEQEVQGIAVPVLDMVVSLAREHLLPNDPILARLPELVTSDMEEPWGGPIRAVDALVAVGQLELALDRAIRASGEDLSPRIRLRPGPFDRR